MRHPHTWVGDGHDDRCADCDTARVRRYAFTPHDHFLYRIPGEKAWRREEPDCAAVAADKMRLDGGAA